jgi:parallel beta-helix repeat protein
MIIFFILFCVVNNISSILFSAEPLKIYVAPKGNDNADGSLDAPFATLERVRNEIRKRKESQKFTEPIEVLIRGGSYFLPDGIKFEAQDAGTETAPITYRAFPNEKPILIGGKGIKNFVPHQEKIVKADMTEAGVGDIYFRQLIFDGKRQHLARYPNFDHENPYSGGWAYTAGERIPMGHYIKGETQNEFDLEEKDYRNWKNPNEVEVIVFAKYNWWNDIRSVQSIDPVTRHVVLSQWASYPIRPGDRFYFRNAFEELDSPGEWFLDKETKMLYFYPPDSLEGKDVFVPTTRTILKLEQGTTDLIFFGLTFECCEGDAIQIRDSSRCRIEACTIRNVGDYSGCGVAVNGGYNNSVYGCDIYQIGSKGIVLRGGDRKTLKPANHVAENNYIHHTGVYFARGFGVAVYGVGQRVAHNLIHDGPGMAIWIDGNDHLFEYNHIRHMNLEISDTGAFYVMGRDWITSRGSVIRYNFIHDILGFGKNSLEKWGSPYYAWGIYLDDNTGGIDIIGNIMLRCPRAGVHLHNGRDNRIENNIVADCDSQQMECNGWMESDLSWTSHFSTMVKGYESIANEPAWQNKRNIKLHPKDAVLPNKMIMSGNEFVRNIVFYRNPKSNYVRFNTFPYEHNTVDYNLIWSGGNPVLTGVIVAGKTIGENLAPNSGFENGESGKMPTNWGWQTNPDGNSVIVIDETQHAEGKQSLRIDAHFLKDKPRDNYPLACSIPIPLELGKTYRLAGKFKSLQINSPVRFYVHYREANKGYWSSGANNTKLGTKWEESERVFTVPKPGDSDYIDGMKTFRITVGFNGETGSLFADDISLCEVEAPDEWESWKQKGMDIHSVIADPLFKGEAEMILNKKYADVKGFRLRPDSPALKLGFQQIPVEKIGLYFDPRRASWPIVEAEGVREKPIIAVPKK